MEDNITATGNNGLIGKLIGLFISPRATFESLAKSISTMDYIVPLALLVIVVLVSQSLVMPLAMEESRDRVLQMEQLDEQQRQDALDRIDDAAANPSIMRSLIGVIFAIVLIAITAGVLLFIGNNVLDGQGTFGQAMVIAVYANLIAIPASIVQVPLMLQSQSIKVETGLSLLLPPSLDITVIGRIFNRLDLFGFWQWYLMALGVAILFKVDERRSRMIYLGIWVGFMILLALLIDGRV